MVGKRAAGIYAFLIVGALSVLFAVKFSMAALEAWDGIPITEVITGAVTIVIGVLFLSVFALGCFVYFIYANFLRPSR